MQGQSTVNKVILAGRIVTEPFQRLKNGEAIITFSIMIKEKVRKNELIETFEEIQEIKVKATILGQMKLQKQMAVYLQGKLHTTQYTDDAEIRRYKTFVIANFIDVLDF